ncbi:hypothetical protein Mapa_007458 [Marchantia paleacea]|nr:hypothetical protein Mapa_007458 [Marchantia paleacea]
MYPALARMPTPAIKHPSISLWGSCLMISRSLQVPGSLSSAFTTKYDGRPSETLGIKDHFKPDENPAPPLPLRPLFFISPTIQSVPFCTSSFV